MYQEVNMTEIYEILRQWEFGKSLRYISKHTGLARQTVTRYVRLAQEYGLRQGGGASQITQEMRNYVSSKVCVGRHNVSRGRMWEHCETHTELLKEWLDDELQIKTIVSLLHRHTGVSVPYSTLVRFLKETLGYKKSTEKSTVRIADSEPGEYLEIDFGYMGKIMDKDTGKTRKVWALVFTAEYSRHMFVWLTYRQQVKDVIDGMEHANAFFGGVFKVLLPDNMKTVVVKSDRVNPKINQTFLEYSQVRGFHIDPARVRSPKDKPKVERSVQYVRKSFFQGEDFYSLRDAQEKVEKWILSVAGLREHGTTHKQPLKVFNEEEKDLLLPWEGEFYDVPKFMEVKVHKDQHIVAQKAYYSLPIEYVGLKVQVRIDRNQVRIYFHRQLIKTHPKQEEGKFSTDLMDYPKEIRAYAGRDAESLQRQANEAGRHIGIFGYKLLEQPNKWRMMRLMYHLLGLLNTYSAESVDKACSQLLSLSIIEPYRLDKILLQASENMEIKPALSKVNNVIKPRFARPLSDFDSYGNLDRPGQCGANFSKQSQPNKED